MAQVSSTYKGWEFDATNARLNIRFNGTVIGYVDATGLSITGKVGFNGVAPATRPTGWAITSFTEDKGFAGNSTTAADAVKAVASLVNDLITIGLIDGTVAA